MKKTTWLVFVLFLSITMSPVFCLADINKELTDWVGDGSKNIQKVNELISRGADVNTKDIYGRTPLMLAVMAGNTEIVKLLIDKGADVNAKDHDGETALIEAAGSDNTEIAKLLIDKGADVNAESTPGGTALLRAIYNNHIEVTKLLIDKGADINAKDPNSGKTGLMIAIIKGYTKIATFLIDIGADVKGTENLIPESEERNNFKAGSEPDGFRGIKWGADIIQFTGMEFLEQEQIFVSFGYSRMNFEKNKFDIYRKKNDVLEINGISLEKIEYGFLRGKFLYVSISVRGEENSKKLKFFAFERYGSRAYKSCIVPKVYEWSNRSNPDNNSVTVSLKLDEGDNIPDYYTPQSEGVLRLMSWDTYERNADFEIGKYNKHKQHKQDAT